MESKDLEANSSPLDQLGKMAEEVGELVAAVNGGSISEIGDELGDVIFTACVQARLQKLNPVDCLSRAVDKVTKRKGSWVNGSFVKQNY
jgi:NTP pyrophosphatase (non-canonical NTP hydrolase)